MSHSITTSINDR